MKWLVDLVECAAAGLEEIEKSLGHLSNLEALMRRRIGEMYPELEACFRRTDRDNSGLIDKVLIKSLGTVRRNGAALRSALL